MEQIKELIYAGLGILVGIILGCIIIKWSNHVLDKWDDLNV